MDIHKPKPWHSWREFLKEYGIIVLGVLTALAFEQAVEALHWRHEVEAERRALHGEVRLNLNAILYRRSEQACIDRRLGEIVEVFRRQAYGEPLGLRASVGRPPVWTEETGSWQIALSGQALAHMPLNEKLKLSDAFGTFVDFDVIREREDDVWRRMRLLDEASVLGPNDWVTLHAIYAEARGFNDRMRLYVIYPLTETTMGEKPQMPNTGPEIAAAEAKFCEPMI